MCGIAGVFVFDHNNFYIDRKYLNRMIETNVMAKRGPDGKGFFITQDRKTGLAHTRLSIIDLSEYAAQPMTNEDGTLIISYNGEIYNHAEIRKELEVLNKYSWKTHHSDTETVVHAFEEWGIDCLKKFRGMFAIAVWDDKNKELWLVRDRLGVKPLYYSIHHGRIVFSSDINAILEDPDQVRKVNEKGIYDYLSFLTVPAPDTMFEGIHKLSSGTWLCINKEGNIKTHRYWDMSDEKIDLRFSSEKTICDMLIKELKKSVEYRKESDVPVGVFLSGGIDSCLNATLFSDSGKLPLQAFTVCFEGDSRDDIDEVKYAKETADRLGAKHYVVRISGDDILKTMPFIIELFGEPLADPVSGAQYYVSKLARENGVIVCQIGEGADELFYGYPLWTYFYAAEKYNRIIKSKWLKKLALPVCEKLWGKKSFRYELFRRCAEGFCAFTGTNDLFTEAEKQELLSDRIKDKIKGHTSFEVIRPFYDRFMKNAGKKSALNWMTYLDLNIRMPDLLLTKVDKTGMGVGLEARVPFLDHKFVELVMNIPERMKIKKITRHKTLLKKAVRGIIPDEILSRKKVGFALPISDWYKGAFKDTIDSHINEFLTDTDYLSKDAVNHILKERNVMKIWTLYTLALWWKMYIR